MTEQAPKKNIRVMLSADRQEFTLRIDAWRQTFPIIRLPDQIQLYTHLRDRKDGKYAYQYAPTVEKLRALKRRLAEKG